MSTRRSRRDFLRAAAGATATAPIVLRAQQTPIRSQTVSPNERIGIALFGMGIRGQQDLRSALRTPGVEVAAVADVYDGRLTLARELCGQHVFTTRDYREVLARRDVDAIVIATPDHWHAQMAVDAMKAGKDVYVEKPMVQELAERALVIDTACQTGRILQVGSL